MEPESGLAQPDSREAAEAAAIARESPDASEASAPVSNVEGMKEALLDEDAWSRDRWFNEDIEAHPALMVLRAAFADAIVDAVRFRDETTIHVKREQWRTICLFLKDEPRVQLNFLSDLTAVDMLRLRETPRFDVVAHLYSLTNRTPRRAAEPPPAAPEDRPRRRGTGSVAGTDLERRLLDGAGVLRHVRDHVRR